MLRLCESLSEVMFKFTNVVMYFAPIGVGAAMAFTVGPHGDGRAAEPGQAAADALRSFGCIWLAGACCRPRCCFGCRFGGFCAPWLSRRRLHLPPQRARPRFPRAMESMEALGVPRRIVAFVIPAGYSFNLDGSTLYLAVASIFVAQAAGVHLSFGEQLLMMVTLMLTSKGVAGVPRATLVVLLATAATFHLPTEPIFVILGIDALADMGRTAVNVVGNCLASVVVAKWEGDFGAEPVSEVVLEGMAE